MLSEVQTSTVDYISGYIARRLVSNTDCTVCSGLLESTTRSIRRPELSLISRKDRGGLSYPSDGLKKICEITERKIAECKLNSKLFCYTKILETISIQVVSCCLTQHPTFLQEADHHPLHKYNLIRKICMVYSTVRFKHIARERNLLLKKTRLRPKLTKLILLQHQ